MNKTIHEQLIEKIKERRDIMLGEDEAVGLSPYSDGFMRALDWVLSENEKLESKDCCKSHDDYECGLGTTEMRGYCCPYCPSREHYWRENNCDDCDPGCIICERRRKEKEQPKEIEYVVEFENGDEITLHHSEIDELIRDHIHGHIGQGGIYLITRRETDALNELRRDN